MPRGSGTLRIYQHGGAENMGAEPGSRAPQASSQTDGQAAGGEEEMKLTYVCFNNRMYANTRSNTAKFWGNVRVLDMPTDNPKKDIDLEKMLDNGLPKEALYLSSEQLTVLSRKENGKSNQEMEAVRRGSMRVQSKEFWGRCDILTFNEAKDQDCVHRHRHRTCPPVSPVEQGWEARRDAGQEDHLYSQHRGHPGRWRQLDPGTIKQSGQPMSWPDALGEGVSYGKPSLARRAWTPGSACHLSVLEAGSSLTSILRNFTSLPWLCCCKAKWPLV